MNTCERLAAYVTRASWEEISPEARGKLKQHLLDSLGCALGAIQSASIKTIREQTEFGLTGPCSLIGGNTASPERAAFYNGALVRSLDFSDTLLATGETCHPSDNMAGVLAAAELAGISGREFLVALTIAYHVQCRLTASGVAIMRKGFSDTIQLSISLAAGMSRALKLTQEQTAHAIALCTSSGLGLGAARTGDASGQWKNLAAAATAFQCIHNVLLAKSGITGPLSALADGQGLEEILGKDFGIDWDREGYDAILACSLKRYDGEFHAQSCIEAVLKMRQEHKFRAENIRGIQVDVSVPGYGDLADIHLDSRNVRTREDAEASIPYLLAVALIDGEVGADQFTEQRIQSADVQNLLQKVVSWPSLAYSQDFPTSLKCKVRIGLKGGQIFEMEKDGYEGFFRQPMPVDALLGKFKRLAKGVASQSSQERILECISKLEDRPLGDLVSALRLQNNSKETSGSFSTLVSVA
jgi:2-methylcitrate dehydratase